MEKTEFDRILEEATAAAEQVLARHLPEEAGRQRKVIEAMNYSLTAGGKRLRPVLMRETFRMCGGDGEDIIGCFMAAIEMIHTYSLVHDDLPAMDNDRYRRGRETTWYVYGDAMGILAGDGLLNYAFETALKAVKYCVKDDNTAKETASDTEKLRRMQCVWQALSVLAGKAGIHGMIGGQAVDIMAEGHTEMTGDTAEKPDCQGAEQQLMFIHEHKTAALIQAAMMVGAILAGASEEQVSKIEKCAYNIGIAFQIQDDILDVVGDSAELGKTTGSDALNQKQTYVTLKGLEQAGKDVEALSREAADLLDEFTGEHEFLKALILHLIYRRR
ncbi:MAG TPA: farnesyl-diphosphate synthase [Lachnospiraceae bacterium]|nr:farnesyl-diphosphate synthase [Lachnospiraceae bacterium]